MTNKQILTLYNPNNNQTATSPATMIDLGEQQIVRGDNITLFDPKTILIRPIGVYQLTFSGSFISTVIENLLTIFGTSPELPLLVLAGASFSREILVPNTNNSFFFETAFYNSVENIGLNFFLFTDAPINTVTLLQTSITITRIDI